MSSAQAKAAATVPATAKPPEASSADHCDPAGEYQQSAEMLPAS
eukprot:CAMPEP_0176141850 /NCGR_PEP_ID=MMETSP0120_2-20121206/72143_1 /TAXON_ID=160619 /ORGANISM="Kryptoperidinium foliaceum, Strain CCMP 1326" /LENGTH=43 /DNA_ID= /DNA_START= /DNA_END= /DNA_ORIENTATION=